MLIQLARGIHITEFTKHKTGTGIHVHRVNTDIKMHLLGIFRSRKDQIPGFNRTKKHILKIFSETLQSQVLR